MNRELKSLLNKVNRVASNHRHGNPISERSLDDLSNAHLDFENAERGKKIHDRLNDLSAQLKDIRDGKVKTGIKVEQEGDLMTVSFTLQKVR